MSSIFAPDIFAFVYASSPLTHLDEEMQMATDYFTVPRFDAEGNPSYPEDLPRDANKPPR